MSDTELIGLDKWIVGMINTSPPDSLVGWIGGRVFVSEVPQIIQGAAEPFPDPKAFPCVLVNFLTGDDTRFPANRRIKTETEYSIEAVTTSNGYGRAGQIYKVVDDLFRPVPGDPPVVDTLYILSCVRIRPTHRSHTDRGVRYNYIGGIYQISCQILGI